MKMYLLLFFTTLTLFASSFTKEKKKEIEINHTHFTVLQESYSYYRDKGSRVKFYDANQSNMKKPFLVFELENITGNCSDTGIQEGNYEIKEKQIVFYTRWNRQGHADESPIGSKIETYTVLDDGSLKRESSHLYIERHHRSIHFDDGMQYLFTVPETKKEKELLKTYVEDVEVYFDGTFLFGKEAAKLQSEVSDAMERKRKNRWK